MTGTPNCCQAFFVIAVSSLEHALEFYKIVFDADYRFRDRSLNFASLKANVPGLEYVILWQVPPGLPFERSQIRGTRLTCRCDDLNNMHDTLLLRGIPASPIEAIPGIRFFILTDPDGNEIGFFEVEPE